MHILNSAHNSGGENKLLWAVGTLKQLQNHINFIFIKLMSKKLQTVSGFNHSCLIQTGTEGFSIFAVAVCEIFQREHTQDHIDVADCSKVNVFFRIFWFMPVLRERYRYQMENGNIWNE